eukprot:jgi/Mesvir1/13914/Mv16037-RA.1
MDLLKLVGPSIEKIIRDAPSRKNKELVAECKSVLESLESLHKSGVRSQPAAAQPDPGAGAASVGDSRDGQDSSPRGDSGAPSSTSASELSSPKEGKSSGERHSDTKSPGPVGTPGKPGEASRSSPADQAVENVFRVAKMACETLNTRLMESAVDTIQKMVAYGFLRGEMEGPNAEEHALMTSALDTVCKCKDLGDENIELQVIKALLTMTTSCSFRVHGEGLLKAVRTCYHIFIGSRSEVNQTTAKASLTQMLNVVFRRMEADCASVPPQAIVVAEMYGPAGMVSEGVLQFVQTFLNKVIQEIEVNFYPAVASAVNSLPTAVMAGGRGEGSGGGPLDENPVPATIQNALSIDAMEFSDKDMMDAKDWELNVYKNAVKGVQAPDASADAKASNVLRRDAFLVFRALCKIAGKAGPAEGTPGAIASEVARNDLRGKVLSLELLKILLENSGTVFRTNDKFLVAIRQHLCLSLLKNCAAANAVIFKLSASIFLTLVSKFRASLKVEIGVFFPLMVLRVLENGLPPNFQQKSTVLHFLQRLTQEPQILVDIYVNYDCDLEASNIFERTVIALVKTAQGSNHGPDSSITPAQDWTLRVEAMTCLVSILRALVAWTEGNPESGAATTAAIAAAEAAQDLAEQDASTHNNHSAHGSQGHNNNNNNNNNSTQAANGSHGDDASGAGDADGGSGNNAGGGEDREGSGGAKGLAGSRNTGGHWRQSSGNLREVERFEQKKLFKTEFEEGIVMFNRKPKKGIEFLIKSGKVGGSPAEVAAFLKGTAGLDKTMIGEYLGERDDFNLKVMHAYVDSMDFSVLEFDEAIRAFLNGFRLPGEAQKIDRLMEKFAERYCKDKPTAFRSAETAYVLAYSVIMLNTDAHNPTVKNKMTLKDFIRNNRNITDADELSDEYLTACYNRIVSNEIKLKDEPQKGARPAARSTKGSSLLGLDGVLNLVMRRKQEDVQETSEEIIKHVQSTLRNQDTPSVFHIATQVEHVRPMLELAWLPLLAAFSVPLENSIDPQMVALCLDGFRYTIRLTASQYMTIQRDAFVISLSKFTFLHSASEMRQKNVDAIKILMKVADEDGNYLQGTWVHVLRCVSRFEQLHLIGEGVMTDEKLFAQRKEDDEPRVGSARRAIIRMLPSRMRSSSSPSLSSAGNESGGNNSGSGADSARSLSTTPSNRRGGGGGGGGGSSSHHPHHLGATGSQVGFATHVSAMGSPDDLLRLLIGQLDNQEMNRVFVRSVLLNSEAIVDFVKALCAVSLEELANVTSPRVFGLTKIVEIAHFNMDRIRIVWSFIWHELSEYFITVACHPNLNVAMYAMDSLRQLAIKFLERDELANYTFQNDFLKPFVIVMRKSEKVEIRELIIRCVSQMVYARVKNVKSGWKSMFMVFTTAASDDQKAIVQLAFETVEKIVREYFSYITETESTTFTDCVNCLIAFTNTPFNEDVSLNAIAFLRFCALRLAEGSLGNLEDASAAMGGDQSQSQLTSRTSLDQGQGANGAPSGGPLPDPSSPSAVTCFTDKDTHMYFWFPLLAGLSELTFDPRPSIRKSALEVLFDTLKFHGHMFTSAFWQRVFESVLFPIFDAVRRTKDPDGPTPGSSSDANGDGDSPESGSARGPGGHRRHFISSTEEGEIDAWLYETCTAALQLVVDLFVKFYRVVSWILPKVLHLVCGFMMRPHQSLAAVGVAAYLRLCVNAGPLFSETCWNQVLTALQAAAVTTRPDLTPILVAVTAVLDAKQLARQNQQNQHQGTAALSPAGSGVTGNGLVKGGSGAEGGGHVTGAGGTNGTEVELSPDEVAALSSSLKGAVSLLTCCSSVQLLLVQVANEVFQRHSALLSVSHTVLLLDILEGIATEARAVNTDARMRARVRPILSLSSLADPPLLRLETDASHVYLNMLLHLWNSGGGGEGSQAAAAAAAVQQQQQPAAVMNGKAGAENASEGKGSLTFQGDLSGGDMGDGIPGANKADKTSASATATSSAPGKGPGADKKTAGVDKVQGGQAPMATKVAYTAADRAALRVEPRLVSLCKAVLQAFLHLPGITSVPATGHATGPSAAAAGGHGAPHDSGHGSSAAAGGQAKGGPQGGAGGGNAPSGIAGGGAPAAAATWGAFKPSTPAPRVLLDATQRKEVAGRQTLLIPVLAALRSLDMDTFQKYLPETFPLLSELVRCQYMQADVQAWLGDIFAHRVAACLPLPAILGK